LDIRLFAAAAVRGVVRDASGKPVAGAQVIGVLDKPPMGFDMGPVEEVSSDSEGRFLLPHAPLGEVALRASAAGFELGESLIYLREDAENDLVLKPGKGRELVVTVDGVPADRLADIECNLFASRAFPMPS